MGMLLKVIFSAMINFTVGMVCSIFVFLFKLPWILMDYKPGMVSHTTSHALAVTTGVSSSVQETRSMMPWHDDGL